MRALTLWQPWAAFITKGIKQFETRSWGTSYRGRLLIHAAKRPVDRQGLINYRNAMQRNSLLPMVLADLPRGCIVAECELKDCILMTDEIISSQTQLERAVGDWQPGRYAWQLVNVKPTRLIYCSGKQGLWIPN